MKERKTGMTTTTLCYIENDNKYEKILKVTEYAFGSL